jgi:hypothetical protein
MPTSSVPMMEMFPLLENFPMLWELRFNVFSENSLVLQYYNLIGQWETQESGEILGADIAFVFLFHPQTEQPQWGNNILCSK